MCGGFGHFVCSISNQYVVSVRAVVFERENIYFSHSLTHEFEREARECKLYHPLVGISLEYTLEYTNTNARTQVRLVEMPFR